MPTIAEEKDVGPPSREDVEDVELRPKIIFYAGGRLMPDGNRAPKGGVYVSPPKWLGPPPQVIRYAGGRLMSDGNRAPKGGIYIELPEQESPPAEATSSSHPDSVASGAQQAASAECVAASLDCQRVVSSSPAVSAVAEKPERPGVLPLPVDTSAPAVAGMAPTSANLLPIPASASGPSQSVGFTAAIISRAEHISVAAQWIGLLEIIAFCALIKQRVILRLEAGDLDVVASLAPAVMDSSWKLMPLPGRIVACKLEGALWKVASFETCTHYVAAKPLEHPWPLHGDGVVAHMGHFGLLHDHDPRQWGLRT